MSKERIRNREKLDEQGEEDIDEKLDEQEERLN